MPLKLNVGLSRKVGEANYSSRGASVNVELELESGLAQEPDRLQARIQQLFGMARDSVDQELHNGNGQHAANGHANGSGSHGNAVRPATTSQVRALHAIANRQRLDLQQCLGRFGVTRAEDLTLPQASELIDDLKGQRSGAGGSR